MYPVRLVLPLAAVVLALGLAACAPSGPADSRAASWEDDFTAALAAAEAAGKPVMIDFYTNWCGWCRKLDKDVHSHPNFLAAADAFVLAKINPEKAPDGDELARKYKVTGFPTTVFVAPDGALLHRVVGYLSVGDFVKEMTTAAEAFAAWTEKNPAPDAG